MPENFEHICQNIIHSSPFPVCLFVCFLYISVLLFSRLASSTYLVILPPVVLSPVLPCLAAGGAVRFELPDFRLRGRTKRRLVSAHALHIFFL